MKFPRRQKRKTQIRKKVQKSQPLDLEYPLVEYSDKKVFNRPIIETIQIIDSFGSTIYPVKRISAEEIILPNKENIYTGVLPEPRYFKDTSPKEVLKYNLSKIIPFYTKSLWRINNVNYAFRGMPFTFRVRDMKYIDEEKKIGILIDQGLCIPFNLDFDRRIFILLSRETGNPIFKDDILLDETEETLKTKYEGWIKTAKEKFKETLSEEDKCLDLDYNINKYISVGKLKQWIKDHKGIINTLEIHELPIKTQIDVTEIEMIRGEWGQIIKGKVLDKYTQSQNNIGDAKDQSLIYMIIALLTVVFVVFIMMNPNMLGSV